MSIENSNVNSNKSGKEPEPVQSLKKNDKKTGDFIPGLLTFILFLIFMTLWMYFGVTDEIIR